MIREEILAGVPDRYLEIVEDNDNIEWREEGKEFSYKGDFYDVVRIKTIHGTRFLFCLNDENEEQLVKNFAKTVKSSNDNERGKNNKHSFKFHLMDEHVINVLSPTPFEYESLHTFCNFKAALVSNSREVIIPPPWGLCSI